MGYGIMIMSVDNTIKMDPIASHLQALYGKKNWHVLWQTYTLTRNWEKVVGSKIAKRSEPAYVQKNTLWVHVQDSGWMQHLQTMKPQLVEKVRLFLPEMEINDIRWIIQPAEPHTTDRQIDPSKEHSPDPGQEKYFKEMSSIVENKECRTALNKLWRIYNKY